MFLTELHKKISLLPDRMLEKGGKTPKKNTLKFLEF